MKALAHLAVVVLVVAACFPAGGAGSSTRPSDGASPSLEPLAPPLKPEPSPVRLALDWTPNTNHTGFFAARARGWYEEARIALEVLPWTGTAPETLMAAGRADCGISFQDSLTFAVAAGAPIRSVMAILQHAASEIAVLASSRYARPSDLDGTTYAGFGYPNEEPTVRAVIVADGGRGEFAVATLDTAAYEALYGGRADFSIVFTAWEGIEARLRGIGLRTFRFTDYGFPDFYQVVLACDTRWLEQRPDVAERFVAATVKGFELADVDPDSGAAMLIAENPGVFDANPELPQESARFLARGGYLVDGQGRVGTQDLAQWRGYSGFLYDQGLLVGPDGAPLATAPDYASLFTNEFLPSP